MPLFHSFFKSLEKKGTVEVIIELKNDMALRGVLLSGMWASIFLSFF